MSATEETYERALGAFRNGLNNDRLAHAYLVIGDPTSGGGALRFADAVSAMLMCQAAEGERPCGQCRACVRVGQGKHPDVFCIEPEKKSRIISVNAMRELMRKLSQSSFEGGWKVAVIIFADRMNDESANAFLKTLEEPPKRTLLLLLTDSPQALLPTILSRCQRVNILEPERKKQTDWSERLDDILGVGNLSDPLVQATLAKRLEALLEDQKEAIAALEKEKSADREEKEEVIEARIEARLKEVRSQIFRSVIMWQRDILLLVTGCDESGLFHADHVEAIRGVASALDPTAALRRVRAAEEMIERLDRVSKPAGPIFEAGFARMG